jgi:stalled ribosome alternative rescue factor ArfA
MSKTYVHSKANRERMLIVQELRRSSASQPHTSKKAYSRKPKHKGEMYV